MKVKGFPGGVLDVRRGSVEAKGLNFSNGTIDFEVKPPAGGIMGIKFRQQDKDNAEVFYIRPQPNCAMAYDCIQYMPISHGGFEWDLFPQYEAAAPIHPNAWNHIRLVVSGRRMKVFVNGGTKPSLQVGMLDGTSLSGSIDLHGPGSFANLVVIPNKVDGLPGAVQTIGGADPRWLRNWSAAGPVHEPTVMDADLKESVGAAPKYDRMPTNPSAWRQVDAEPSGLVNLTRDIGSAQDGNVISGAWLKTTLISNHTGSVHVSVGWVREIWVFVNGNLVYADRNLYGVPSASKPPDGRLSLENGAFNLPLRKGVNEVAVYLDDNLPDNTQHYGWGFEMRLSSLKGLHSGVAS